MALDNILFRLSYREASKGFLISLRVGNRSRKYLEGLELSLALLANYAEAHAWPPLPDVTTAHLEEYLAYLQDRPRWFGTRQPAQGAKLSQSSVETHYRRLKRFWAWLVERGHVTSSPLDLIPRPRVDQRIIPTVSEREARNLMRLVDPKRARTSGERYRAYRNRAALLILVDTPGRLTEITSLRLSDIDEDLGTIKVFGKGAKERRMALGDAAQEALWSYIQIRTEIASNAQNALWLDEKGQPMKGIWLYLALKRLGERAGVPGLHTHRFRHTYAVAALRGGMPERVLAIVGGWKRIPDTYLRTLGMDDAIRFHREISPGDKLSQAGPERTGKKGRWRL